jgi:hypothetical protein
MNTKSLLIAILSGAVLTTLVSNLPVIGLVNILCFAGFWASAIFAIWLYRRLTGMVTIGQAVLIGALTGLCAGILGFSISFLGWAGFQGMVNGLSQVLPPETMQDMKNTPMSDILAFNLAGVATNLIFGALGGLLGGAIFRTDRLIKKAEVQA